MKGSSNYTKSHTMALCKFQTTRRVPVKCVLVLQQKKHKKPESCLFCSPRFHFCVFPLIHQSEIIASSQSLVIVSLLPVQSMPNNSSNQDESAGASANYSSYLFVFQMFGQSLGRATGRRTSVCTDETSVLATRCCAPETFGRYALLTSAQGVALEGVRGTKISESVVACPSVIVVKATALGASWWILTRTPATFVF